MGQYVLDLVYLFGTPVLENAIIKFHDSPEFSRTCVNPVAFVLAKIVCSGKQFVSHSSAFITIELVKLGKYLFYRCSRVETNDFGLGFTLKQLVNLICDHYVGVEILLDCPVDFKLPYTICNAFPVIVTESKE